MFFTFPNISTLHVRETSINTYDSWRQSAVISGVLPAGGSPTLDRSYTVTTDTLAAISLARYLDRVGLGRGVSFEVTGQDGSMDLLEHASVVAFGAHNTLQPFQDYLATMNFKLATNEAWVDNLHPRPGEAGRYVVHPEAPGVAVEPAIVALLPGRGPNVKLLIMQSKHTSALVDLLTSQVGNSRVRKMYMEAGSPPFFEMVVESEVSGDRIVRSWPVALHPYTLPAPSGVDVTR